LQATVEWPTRRCSPGRTSAETRAPRRLRRCKNRRTQSWFRRDLRTALATHSSGGRSHMIRVNHQHLQPVSARCCYIDCARFPTPQVAPLFEREASHTTSSSPSQARGAAVSVLRPRRYCSHRSGAKIEHTATLRCNDFDWLGNTADLTSVSLKRRRTIS
jgi:hypothetical protein